MTRPQLIIAPGKEKALLRRHPWVFSGAVRRVEGKPQEGDLVDICAADGTWLATGLYEGGSIICKVLSFDTHDIDRAFFRDLLASAIDYRRSMGFVPLRPLEPLKPLTPLMPLRPLRPLKPLTPSTNVFRLVHAEGDGLPGLVCDWYNGVLVMQAHSVGMHLRFPMFVELFRELLGDALLSVFDKSRTTVPGGCDDGYLWGITPDEWEITENGNRMLINFFEGQKTGFFLDQRDNRKLVADLARGRRVLNCFGYTGGFSLAALRGGAEYVETVDISKKAIELCNRNVELNFPGCTNHRGTVADVLDFLAQPKDRATRQGTADVSHAEAHSGAAYDFIILDPPAFAKNHRSLQQGLRGYRAINQRAMEVLPKGGLLMTFSCSQAVSVDDFRTMVFTSAANAKRQVRIVRSLPHAADHPVSIYHPEGEYLKGLLLEVRS